jgi:hypothetical protein
MPQRFLAFLLFGVLSLVALDSFEWRAGQRGEVTLATPAGLSSDVQAMDGTNGAPPGPYKKAF